MCGIVGVVDTSGNDIEADMIRCMASTMFHRGPDDDGVYISNSELKTHNSKLNIGLGHRRLSIIDLSSAGHQPMSNEDGTIWIVFNGEVYNFEELRSELLAKGHTFKSRTDTETIIHLYEEEQERCVKRLRGMFAFGIWDKTNQRLFLARDRVGKKPLYYTISGTTFIFASEIKAILKWKDVNIHLNELSLHHYLTYGYTPPPDTMFEGIKNLAPSHILVYENNDIRIERYWRLSYIPKEKLNEEDCKDRIISLLTDAVRVRLVSDVPLGVFLSGGIDSSAVVAMMSRLKNNRIKTFSIGFDERDYSELKYARLVAKRFNTDHKELIVKPDLLDILPKLVWHYNEPFGDSSCVPSYYVAKMTREFVTVALNGDGGDESFGGYERYIGTKLGIYLQFLPSYVSAMLSKSLDILGSMSFMESRKRDIARRRNFFDALSKYRDYEKRYARWMSFFTNEHKESLYSEQFKDRICASDSYRILLNLIKDSDGFDAVDRVMNTDVLSYLPSDLLVKMDIAAMANSLEARSPFLDHHLMEFCARLPSNYKVRGFHTKYILKKALRGILPDEILKRGKMGFGVPIGVWFKDRLKDYVEDILLSSSFKSREYFNMDYIKQILGEHTSGKQDHTHRIWALINFELWCRIFIDNSIRF